MKGQSWAEKRNHRIYLAILACLVLIAYLNSLNGAFVSDDITGIRDNPNISNLNSSSIIHLRGIFYVTIYRLFGASPFFYHLLNVLFHLGNTWVVYFLVGLLSSFPLAVFASAIFAVHPILSESVTWISGGSYSQYAFFSLLSLVFYILAAKKNYSKNYFLSLFFFLLALLSSERAMILPFIVLLWEICFGKIVMNWRRLIPFFVFGGMAIIGAMTRIDERISSLEGMQEKGLYNPLVQIPIAITSYLQLFFWPSGLTLYHSEMSFTWPEYLFKLMIFILFLAVIVYSYRRNRTLFFWLVFFIITLLPTLTPFRISWIVAERYVYLGALGIFAAAGLLFEKLSRRPKFKTASYLIFSLIIIALAGTTIKRNVDWQNEDNLWLATAKTSPNSPNAHNNMGDYYARHNDLENSAKEFQKAIELKPDYAEAYNNLANTYAHMGKTEEAVKNYQEAIRFNPNIWQSHFGLAVIYLQQGKNDLARDSLLKAAKLKPDEPNIKKLLTSLP